MDSITRKFSLLCLGVVATATVAACASNAASQCEATGVLCPSGMHCAAAEPICISDLNLCGNAHLDPGEVCDDGNTKDGDGCSADCKSDESCGNGRVDTTVGEVCDEPLKKDASGKYTCSANCKSNETCGNGVIDKEVGEVCDDGNQVDGDGCSKDCKSDETCGNGTVDSAVGEVCDDGNTIDGDACSHCTAGRGCGNGIIDHDPTTHLAIEECDDGNTDNNDDCRNDCVVNRCGDGVVDSNGTHKEQCDAAPVQSGGSRSVSPTESDTCNTDCTNASCGDGRINRHFKPDGVHPEQCDSGTVGGTSLNQDTAVCTAACQTNVCGDGHPLANVEACDEGGVDTATCDFDCTKPLCGDGVRNPAFGEECDNGLGNNADDAACTSTCKINVCGDHNVLKDIEQCDSGGVDTSTCDQDCTAPVCGDGHTNSMANEACDDGNKNGTAASPNGCNQFCQFNSCGNGVTDHGEDCDAGSNGVKADSQTCDSDCTFAKCGDGHTNGQAGETCDDGPDNGTTDSAHNCNAFCHVKRCGNGLLEQGEACDDGDGNNGTGKRCNDQCQLNVCGDTDVLTDIEQCDPGRDTSGHPKDTSTCDADCTFAVCGDHHINLAANEECDDGADNGTAASANHCDARCKKNLCGNGIVDVGEDCDAGSNGTRAESSTCNSDCTFARCGDGKTNHAAGENCDNIDSSGASLNGVPCAYGDPMCTRCNATCTDPNFHPGGPFCGDGIPQTGFEQCDPTTGPATTLPSLLAKADSTTCDIDCTPVACGDGHINAVFGEGCDDGNNDSCGTCAAGCLAAAITAKQAASSITTTDASGSNIGIGDTFVLDDGFGNALTFEYDLGTQINTGTVQKIVFVQTPTADSAETIATKTRDVINGLTGFGIQATVASGAHVVVLTNKKASSLGNTTITVTDIAPTGGIKNTFTFANNSKMAGGAAGNCPKDTGCKSDDDCATTCDLTTLKCK